MNRNLKNALALGALVLLGTANAANAQTYTFLPNDAMINSAVNTNNTVVGYASGTFDANYNPHFTNPSSPKVSIVSGGNIQERLYSFNSSAVTMNGGHIGYLAVAKDNSTIAIGGGSVDYLFAQDSSHINLTGGNIGVEVHADNSSVVNIRGGVIGQGLYAFGLGGTGGTLNIYGANLTATLINPAYNTYYSQYAFSGTLQDGTVYNNRNLVIQNGTAASFHLIPTAVSTPAPSSVLVVLLGAVPLVGVLRRRRK